MLSPGLIPAVREDGESAQLNLTEEEFIAAVEHQPRPLVVPLSLERPIPGISPLTIYSGLPGPGGFLLESMEGSEKMARYSFLGKDPDLTVTFGEEVRVEGREPLLSIARFSGRGKRHRAGSSPSSGGSIS